MFVLIMNDGIIGEPFGLFERKRVTEPDERVSIMYLYK